MTAEELKALRPGDLIEENLGIALEQPVIGEWSIHNIASSASLELNCVSRSIFCVVGFDKNRNPLGCEVVRLDKDPERWERYVPK